MDSVTIFGEVGSGLGLGKAFVAKEWVRRQCLEKLGFTPFTGTFNVKIRGDTVEAFLQNLQQAPGIEILPGEPNFCKGRCIRVEIANLIQGAVVIPEKTGHLPETLEIIAPVNIRETLGLQDGETVMIKLTV